ncbi:MAG: hypothetical protein ACYS0G_05990 [Planctomycetota bacterium]|jgi:hypothetical protein
MSVSAVSGSSLAAIGAGVRGELKSTVLNRALNDAGLLDQNLARGLQAIEALAQSKTKSGLAALRADTAGTLIDVLA